MPGGTSLWEKIKKRRREYEERQRGAKRALRPPIPGSLLWERAKNTLIKEAEASHERALFARQRFRKLPKFSSEVVNRGSRADPLLDRVILQQIEKKTRRGARVALTSCKPRAVPKRGKSKRTRSNAPSINPNPTTKTIPTLLKEARLRFTKERDGRGKWVHKVYLPPWDHTTPIIKSLAYAASLPPKQTRTINLKLSDEVIDKALRSRFGFVVYMQKEIAKALRKHLPREVGVPDFVIAVEGGLPISRPGEKLDMVDPFHIHGAIYIPPEDITIIRFNDNESDIEEALIEAAGAFPVKQRARQLKMDRMYNVAGWFAYVSKARLTTQDALKSARRRLGLPAIKEESLVAATVSIRKSGKRWYEEARKSEDPVLYQAKKPRSRSGKGKPKGSKR